MQYTQSLVSKSAKQTKKPENVTHRQDKNQIMGGKKTEIMKIV